MNIHEAISYEEYKYMQSTESWVTADRYEYCDGFYEKTKVERTGLLQRIKAVLASR